MMPHKMIPHSVRLSEEDTEFIAELNIPGAVSSSEKIRAIIKERREKKQRGGTYEGLLFASEEILLPIIHRLKNSELEHEEHSELMSSFLEWLMEVTSYVAYEMNDENKDLAAVEKGIMQRLSRIMDGTLRLGVTPTAPCYDPKVIRNNVTTTLELAALIGAQINKEKQDA